MSYRNRHQMNTRRLPPLAPASNGNTSTTSPLGAGTKPAISPVSLVSVATGPIKSAGHISPNGNLSPAAGGGSGGGQLVKGNTGLAAKHTASHDRLSPPNMVVTGLPLASGSFGLNSRHVSPALNDRHISSYDLNPDVVTTYLNDNPDFLEKYVSTHVSAETVERWSVKRTHAHKNRLKGAESSSTSLGSDEGHKNNKDTISKWKFSLQGDKRQLVQEMTKDIHTQQDRGHVLSELAACVAAAVNAESFDLFLVNEQTKDVYSFKNSTTSRHCLSRMPHKVGVGSNIVSYVAATKDVVRTGDLRDDKHPDGVGDVTDTVNAVLAQPVLANTGEVIGVVQLMRTTSVVQFTEEEEEMYHSMTKQRRLNEFLLTVTKSIFQDIVSMDTVIMKIMNFAQRLVDADRASLFLVDTHSRELYARIFDVGSESGNHTLDVKHREIRFPMDKGVAGHVASTGQVLNIPDAYTDDRFNREVDLQTGYRTNTILCMPIYIRGSIIGVVQMVNKVQGTFSRADEESFETFAVYCGLALHHAKLYEKIRRSEQKYRVALEVLSYHSKAGEDEIDKLQNMQLPERIPRITEYEFSPWAVTNDEKPLQVIYMMRELFSSGIRFDLNNLIRFTLTVRKNYRSVPYHNWAHAFSVAHAMFTIIQTTKNVFTPIECLSLFVACLCHDVDHRGYTNQFMVTSASPLAAIYSTSTMEHHHFNHTITILQHEGHNIFKALSSDEYKQVLGDIKHCILATDLALFFGNRAKLKDIADKGQFEWTNKEHRRLVFSITMTACDLVASSKPWDIQLDTVKVIFEEFYAQGDEEKMSGSTPIAMMDRDQADQLPSCQVGFLVGICLPCYELLAQILPETQPMVDGSQNNLKRWQELADQHKELETKEKQDASKDDEL